jgi:hypothetical protein
MADFEVHLDEENELRFNVTAEGTDATASVKSRMVLESSKMDLVFQGTTIPGGEVSVIVPSLKGVLSEGLYNTRLEVVIDDRIFTPLQLTANFKQSVKVMAEAIVTRRPTRPSVVANVIRVNPSTTQVKKPLTETQSSRTINSTKTTSSSSRNDELRSLLRHVIKKQE